MKYLTLPFLEEYKNDPLMQRDKRISTSSDKGESETTIIAKSPPTN